MKINDFYLYASAIAVLISTIVNIIMFSSNRSILKIQMKDNKERDLENRLTDILKLSFNYPELENPKFTGLWSVSKGLNDDNYIRYENYCILVFNYIEKLYSFNNYNKIEFEKNHSYKDWIVLHKQYWEDPIIPDDNKIAYSKELNELIEEYLK